MIGTSLSVALDLLSRGEIVAIPTETVYGLAANALDPLAVAKIFEAKKRPNFNPLIVHIKSVDEVHKYARQFPRLAQKLAHKFWPGPLSLLLPKSASIPSIVTAGLDSVVLRVPAHPITLELLKSLSFPLAAPSANKFQSISPTTSQHVLKSLGDKVPYILDGGKSAVGVESTIVSFVDEQVTILRYGGISVEEIEKCIGPIQYKNNSETKPTSPGQLAKHYSTKKNLKLVSDIDELLNLKADEKLSIIAFGPTSDFDSHIVYNLSKNSDLIEAAANLFDILHRADEDASERIIVQRLPNIGLGRAINDRLTRAAYL